MNRYPTFILIIIVSIVFLSLGSCSDQDGDNPSPVVTNNGNPDNNGGGDNNSGGEGETDVCDGTSLAVTASVNVYVITATSTGGTAPFEYSLDGTTYQSSATFTDNAPGAYTITVKDANGCTANTTITIVDPCAGMALTAVVEEFSVEASASGGLAPYTFSINGIDFQSEGVFSDLAVDSYTVTAKDANGCTATVAVNSDHLATLLDERDGQRYKIVKIGNQIWMAESLNIKSDTAQYCHNNSTYSCDEYGAIYNWPAAASAVPEGWHLPSRKEWENLIGYLGGEVPAAQKMYVGGESGFEGILAGARNSTGGYSVIGEFVYFWTATEDSDAKAFVFVLSYGDHAKFYNEYKTYGSYIRAVKD